MFLIRFFKWGFNFPQILTRRSQKLWQILLYFFIIISISNFPLTLQTFQNDGARLNFVIEAFTTTPDNSFILPSGDRIVAGKYHTTLTDEYRMDEHEGIILIFNYSGDEQADASNFNTGLYYIAFKHEYMVFFDGNGNFLTSDGYVGFTDAVVNFQTINFSSGDQRTEYFNSFASGIERSFAKYTVIYVALLFLLTQIGVNLLYAIILTLIIQLFRFAYTDFMSIKESFNFVVLSMALPAILAFILGLFIPGFAPTVFNLTLGIIVMLVMLIYAKKILK